VILLVEDDRVLRELTSMYLEARGYRVLLASSGAEALTRVEEEGPQITAIILDFGLPDLGGDELADELRGRLPDCPLFFLTGLRADDPVVRRAMHAGNCRLFSKPVALASLAEQLHEVREGRS